MYRNIYAINWFRLKYVNVVSEILYYNFVNRQRLSYHFQFFIHTHTHGYTHNNNNMKVYVPWHLQIEMRNDIKRQIRTIFNIKNRYFIKINVKDDNNILNDLVSYNIVALLYFIHIAKQIRVEPSKRIHRHTDANIMQS